MPIQKLKTIFVSMLILFSLNVSAQISQGGYPIDLTGLKSTSLVDKKVRMPKFELKSEEISKAQDALLLNKSVTFAHSFNVHLNPNNSGEWFTIGNYRVWKLQIQSEGALSIGLIFNEYKLPEGASLYIFDETKETIYGAFTADNNKSFNKLAIYPFPSEELIIQYEEPLNATFAGELELGKINHDYLGVTLKNRWKKRPSGECNIDINCNSGLNTTEIQRSVVRIIADDELGTATMLNNSAQDGRPILISAFHVFDNNKNAEVTIFDFNYESPYCTGIDGYDLQTISGSKALASCDSLDFMLVELSKTPPQTYRPYYAGWDASGLVPPNSFTIHHPNGDVKKITIDEGKSDSLSFEGGFIKYGHWKVYNWEAGTTEAGSSGAGLFSSGQRLFGTLSGGAASCDNLSYDAFSRLDKMWDYKKVDSLRVKNWLDPKGGNIRRIDGFDPYSEKDASCTVISNFMVEDVLNSVSNKIDISSITEVAERFASTNFAIISGVAVGIEMVKVHSIYPELIVRIYTGEEVPENAIKQFRFPLQKATANAMNYFTFPESIKVKGTFFIGLEVNQEKDTISLFQSDFRGFAEHNSMLVYDNSEWKSVSEYSSDGKGASLLMEATVCGASFVVDIDSIDDQLQLMSAYPNPASEYLMIEFKEPQETNEISVYDMTGRLLYNECYQQRNYVELNVSTYKTGLYLLNIKTSDKTETRRIVIR